MRRKVSINRPTITDLTADMPLLLPPGFQLLNWVTNWRKTWSHIVTGKFSSSPYSSLFCYDRDNGCATFYATDGLGGLSTLKDYPNLADSWDQLICGVFDDSGYDGVLGYDQESGAATFYRTDGQGSLIPLNKVPESWGSRWTHIVVAPFNDSKYSGVLLYDQSA